MFNKQNIQPAIVALLIAVVLLIISYFLSIWPYTTGSESFQLQRFEGIRRTLFDGAQTDIEDSVILIDVHYDRTMVMEYESITDYKGDSASLEKGKVPVVDRQKLLALFKWLKQRDDYQYVILDVFLEKCVAQAEDSALYALLSQMPRLAIPLPPDGQELADKSLEDKAAAVSYGTSAKGRGFLKYTYIVDDRASLPLKMYAELTHDTIVQSGCFYREGYSLARPCGILTYDFEDEAGKYYLGDFIKQIGESDDEIGTIQTKGKYILIGDFEDDRHQTFIGRLSGTIINFNAYLSLKNGHHRVSLIKIFLLLVLLWIPSYYTLRWHSFQEKRIRLINSVRNEKLKRILLYIHNKEILSWIDYPAYFVLSCYSIYIITHEAYDILILVMFFCFFRYFIKHYTH